MKNRHIADYSPRLAHMNIYVGNLPLTVTASELQKAFMAFGQVVSVSVMNDEYIGSRQPRGYGFVEMATRSEGEAAVAGLNGKSLRNQVVSVIEALPLSPSRSATSGNSKFRCRSEVSGARFAMAGGSTVCHSERSREPLSDGLRVSRAIPTLST